MRWIPAIVACLLSGATFAQDDPAAWRAAEAGVLEHHVQLTFADRFVKAGEAYFSPDDSQIIFQAVEQPAEGEKPEAFFQMFVADVVYDESGAIRGLKNYKRLSPPGSWNTCGWFHPTREGVVIFGSTIVVPENPERVGFQRDIRRYSWWFPREMTIVECDLAAADGTAEMLRPIIEDDEAYVAECVLSPDGRYLAYCRRAEKDGPLGGDLIIRDLTTGRDVVVAGAPGYDGGPFFSPDGRRLCYRSDRDGDDLLQVFVAELAFDAADSITGVAREFQVTDENAVNWAPWWTRDGRYLLYTSSALGHQNYEIFLVDADPGNLPSHEGPARYGIRTRRITQAHRFDGLPALNSDGSVMIWTSQRAGDGSSQLWAASFVLDLHDTSAMVEVAPELEQPLRGDFLHVTDPADGTIYVYNLKTHEVSIYDPVTHTQTKVTDGVKFKRASELFAERESDREKD